MAGVTVALHNSLCFIFMLVEMMMKQRRIGREIFLRGGFSQK